MPVGAAVGIILHNAAESRYTNGLFINKSLYGFSERLTRLVNLSEKRVTNFITVP